MNAGMPHEGGMKLRTMKSSDRGRQDGRTQPCTKATGVGFRPLLRGFYASLRLFCEVRPPMPLSAL